MLVGASGSILTKQMADAMNRSIGNVFFAGVGAGGPDAAAAETGGTVRSTSAADVAIQLSYARLVVVVPGYGMAVAQAQRAVADLAAELEKRGVEVLYAIHPVAGRMPGHMNVLLAEADVPYDKLKEMDDINGEFARTDVALVIGANDVTNPAARTVTDSPIYGMPILDVDKSQLGDRAQALDELAASRASTTRSSTTRRPRCSSATRSPRFPRSSGKCNSSDTASRAGRSTFPPNATLTLIHGARRRRAARAGRRPAPLSPDIVISEVYGGGGQLPAPRSRTTSSSSTTAAPTPVALDGLAVQYAARPAPPGSATVLSGTIAPGGHYLVQEAAGRAARTPLPTPDATGSIAMSATAGKVALVTDRRALTCGGDCDAAPGVRDLVGYGTANDFEGAAPAPGLSNTDRRQPQRRRRRSTPTTTPPTSRAARPTRATAPARAPARRSPSPARPSRIHDVQGAQHVSPLRRAARRGRRASSPRRPHARATGSRTRTPTPTRARREGIFVFTAAPASPWTTRCW